MCIFFGKMSFQGLCPFLNQVVWFFFLSFRSSLCWISLPYQICKFQIFSLILWVSFYFSKQLKIIWPYIWGFNSGLCILFIWDIYVHTHTHTHIYANPVLFWLLKFFSKLYNQKVWILKICSSFTRLSWLSEVSWDSTWILGWGFLLPHTQTKKKKKSLRIFFNL